MFNIDLALSYVGMCAAFYLEFGIALWNISIKLTGKFKGCLTNCENHPKLPNLPANCSSTGKNECTN